MKVNGHTCRIFPPFYRGVDIGHILFCFSAYLATAGKVSTLKRSNLLPGKQIHSFDGITVDKGDKNIFDQVTYLAGVSINL